MAIESTLVEIEYVGNGAGKQYSFPFPVLEPEHLVVFVTNVNGEDAGYVYGQDYAITINTNADGQPTSAKITLSKALPKKWKIRVRREMPIIQSIRMSNHIGYFPQASESGLDYLTMVCQQIDSNAFRVATEFNVRLTDVEGNVLVLQKTVTDFSSRIATVELSLNQSVSALTTRINTTDKNLKSSVSSLTSLINGVEKNLTSSVASLNQSIESLSDYTFRKSEEFASRIRILENDVATHLTAINPHPQYIQRSESPVVFDDIFEADISNDLQIKTEISYFYSDFFETDEDGDVQFKSLITAHQSGYYLIDAWNDIMPY